MLKEGVLIRFLDANHPSEPFRDSLYDLPNIIMLLGSVNSVEFMRIVQVLT